MVQLPTHSPINSDDDDMCMIPPTPWIKPKRSFIDSWQTRLSEDENQNIAGSVHVHYYIV